MLAFLYINGVKMKEIKNILKKFLTKEVIMYIVFGILTTLINIITSFILTTVLKIEGNISSTIGIICSILFAYFTNKKWVFNSTANTYKEKMKEFGKFIFGRLFTMVIEILGVYLLNNVIYAFYGLLSDNMAYLVNKIIITVIVIILNFIISKYFTFNKKRKQGKI